MAKKDLIIRRKQLPKQKSIWWQTKSLSDGWCLRGVKSFLNRRHLLIKMKFLKSQLVLSGIWLWHRRSKWTRMSLKMCGFLVIKLSLLFRRASSCLGLRKLLWSNKSHLRSKRRVNHLCRSLIKFHCLAKTSSNFQSGTWPSWIRSQVSVHKQVDRKSEVGWFLI
jgi:hypothetical protein